MLNTSVNSSSNSAEPILMRQRDWNHSSLLDPQYIICRDEEDEKDGSEPPLNCCCGCLDFGPFYVCFHCCNLPFSFGRLAHLTNEDNDRFFCGALLTAGFLLGGSVFGGPVLPCAVRVRRQQVAKYGLKESYPSSIAHICLCPAGSLVQMLMQAEEEEFVRVGCCGSLIADDESMSLQDPAAYQRMER